MVTNHLRIIILAAGKGTRMKSQVPKVLHQVGNLPLLLHVIKVAEELAPEKITTVLAPNMDKVAAAVQPYETAIQKEALGTAHAVMAADTIFNNFEGNILILLGDVPLLKKTTLETLLRAQAEDHSIALSILGMRPENPQGYGRIILNSSGFAAKIVEEKEASADENQVNLCNTGIFLVKASLLKDLLAQVQNTNKKGEYYLTDIVEIAAKKDLKCQVVEVADSTEVMGINSQADLAQAEFLFQQQKRSAALENGVTLVDPQNVYFSFDTKIAAGVTIYPHVYFGPGVQVEKEVILHPFCHLAGVHLKKGAEIGPFARLRPSTLVGENVKIGNFVEVKKSTLARGVKVSHLSYIGDTTIGENANIGAGTITCNYDGFRKSETHIGAEAFIGSNTALIAPVKVGEGAIVGAGSVITKEVPKDAIALSRAPQETHLSAAKKFKTRYKEKR